MGRRKQSEQAARLSATPVEITGLRPEELLQLFQRTQELLQQAQAELGRLRAQAPYSFTFTEGSQVTMIISKDAAMSSFTNNNKGVIGSMAQGEKAQSVNADEVAQRTYQEYAKPDQSPDRINYDVQRARLICTALGLSYERGPYIAFFDEHPTLPRYETLNEHEHGMTGRYTVVRDGDRTSLPVTVLSFGGLPEPRVRQLLDELEQQILREKFEPSSLIWRQRLYRLGQWCKTNGRGVVEFLTVARTVVTGKEP